MPELKFSPAPIIYERHKNLLDLGDAGGYVIQDEGLLREQSGGTYTPVGGIKL
jgi:hypothetical protein